MMTLQLKELISYLEGSALADNIRENDVLFPLIESVHVLAICLVVGSILAVDLRLLGVAWIKRSVSSVTRGVLPLTWGAFVVAVGSGGLMFISNATKYLGNGYFIAKMVLIGVAGLNMLIFHFISARDQPRWDNQAAAAIIRAACRRHFDGVVDRGGRVRPLDRLHHGARMT